MAVMCHVLVRARTKSPCGDKRICRYEAVAFEWGNGGIGMAGNRISHLVQSNDAVRLSYANELYQKRDGANWMRGLLHAGGFQVIHVRNPHEEQDVVNLQTLQASEAQVLQEATSEADTAVGDAITHHANILNREIRTKSLNLDPQATATKNFSLGG